jgi:hypothetical protein
VIAHLTKGIEYTDLFTIQVLLPLLLWRSWRTFVYALDLVDLALLVQQRLIQLYPAEAPSPWLESALT